MANLEQVLELITLVSAADMTTAQYRFVVVDSAGKVDFPAAGAVVDGVNQEAPAAGEATVIAIAGISFVEVGTGGVTAGNLVTTDAAGKVLEATTGDALIGRAMATAAEGELAAVLLGFKGTSA